MILRVIISFRSGVKPVLQLRKESCRPGRRRHGRGRGVLRACSSAVRSAGPCGASRTSRQARRGKAAAPNRESAMKPDLHPVYPPSRIVCACGNVIETRSTRGSFHVEICSNCHPFFTGKYKLVDTEGRVERFRKKYENKPAAEAKKPAKAVKAKA